MDTLLSVMDGASGSLTRGAGGLQHRQQCEPSYLIGQLRVALWEQKPTARQVCEPQETVPDCSPHCPHCGEEGIACPDRFWCDTMAGRTREGWGAGRMWKGMREMRGRSAGSRGCVIARRQPGQATMTRGYG